MDYSSSLDSNINPFNLHFASKLQKREVSDLASADLSRNWLVKDESVKDGYQWRKYGQEITKDNPSPRTYFRCSFSPSCQVKKKVQRNAEDPSLLVANYEGKHNHPGPHVGGSRTVKFDLVQGDLGLVKEKKERGTVQEVLTQQMALC